MIFIIFSLELPIFSLELPIFSLEWLIISAIFIQQLPSSFLVSFLPTLSFILL